MLAKSKLNSSETLVLHVLTNMEINHEEFYTILKEKDKYERMKDNLRSENEKYEIVKLSSIKSKTSVKNCWVFYAIKNIFFSCVCIKCFKSAKEKKRKIKTCRKSSKRFLEFKKELGLDPDVVTCDEQDNINIFAR